MATRITAVIGACALVVSACGGGASATSTTAEPITTAATTTTTLPPTTTTSSTTTTTTTVPPTTTTTVPPTTTTTTLPPAVTGWEGAGVSAVAIEIEFEYPLAALDMRATLRGFLREMGITSDDHADAILSLDLDGKGVSRSYRNLGRCYGGARVSGPVTLSAPDLPTREKRISYEYASPTVLFTSECATDAEDAPYAVAFSTAVISALTAIWAEESAPALLAIIAADVQDTREDLPRKAVAMDAFRGLDTDLLDTELIVAVLDAAIDTVEYIVDNDYTPHGADVAARRLLTEFSPTNYGVATMDDVSQWRDWLETWEEDQS